MAELEEERTGKVEEEEKREVVLRKDGSQKACEYSSSRGV